MHKGLDPWLPACAALGGVIIAVIASHFGGFLGILLAGLLIGFVSVRYERRRRLSIGQPLLPASGRSRANDSGRTHRQSSGTAGAVAAIGGGKDDQCRPHRAWPRRLLVLVKQSWQLSPFRAAASGAAGSRTGPQVPPDRIASPRSRSRRTRPDSIRRKPADRSRGN
jgi:hypothetical protein